jgi:hypothetical protein
MSQVVLFNMLKLSDEELDTIAALAAMNYDHHQMAIYLEKDFIEFEKARKQNNSAIQFHITRGKLQTQLLINDKLKINAEAGNITAAQEYVKAVNRIEVEQVKRKILFYEED